MSTRPRITVGYAAFLPLACYMIYLLYIYIYLHQYVCISI
jgi:hypothetical protein